MSGDSIVVMKFGGTSVATREGRSSIARRVEAALESGRSPVVVVSAMGRAGAPYATDTLLSLLAGLPASERESDMLASIGEIISAVLVAHELRAEGIPAAAFSGADAGIVTDGAYGGASITHIHPGPLFTAIGEGTVPVVAGFQGVAEDGTTTTLGRGGSDTTACALGVALGAEEVEIYTDVDGVMTSDPRTCEDANVLEVVGADELFQMAMHGSRVVHTPAAELALASGLSVRVRNTYTDHPGTVVADIAAYRPSSVATAVSHASGVIRYRVSIGDGDEDTTHAQTRLYEAMADAGVSLDMFTPLGHEMVFSVKTGDEDAAEHVLRTLASEYVRDEGLGKVTLVGAGMHGVPGVMARMARCLDDAGVRILQTADSHTTISVLVPEEHVTSAVVSLHRGFELGG